MKTSKEFFERLKSDETFAEQVRVKVQEKIEAGESDYKAIWIPAAKEYGYELTGEELDELYSQATVELSEEELGKAAGGIIPLIVLVSAASAAGLASTAAFSVAVTVATAVKKDDTNVSEGGASGTW